MWFDIRDKDCKSLKKKSVWKCCKSVWICCNVFRRNGVNQIDVCKSVWICGLEILFIGEMMIRTETAGQ